MKTLKQLFVAFLALTSTLSIAQEAPVFYTTADSGLIVREEPSMEARRIGKLPLGTAVDIVMRTGDHFQVWNDGQKLEGEWVLVKTRETIEENLGFVFSGFLEDINKPHPVKVNFVDVALVLDGLKIEDPEIQFETHLDTVTMNLDLAASYSDKPIQVKQGMYKKVALYQKLENEGFAQKVDDGIAHPEEAYGGWMQLPVAKRNTAFKPYPYATKVWERFLTDAQSSATTASKIHLKVVLTDWRNKKTERLVIFNLVQPEAENSETVTAEVTETTQD